MKDLSSISQELFNKVRARFQNLTLGDQDGNITNSPEEARFFDFDYTDNDTKIGTVSISLDDENGLTVIYSKDFITDQDELAKKNWYGFLRDLRKFSKKRLMNFEIRDITKNNLTKRDYKYLSKKNHGDNNMNESKLYGTGRVSYQNVDNARIMIKHNENIDQEKTAARTRNIKSIYIESADGERFKYPYRHLSGARAMARHVAEGGKPYDEFGTHITTLSEEMWKLRKFKNYVGRSNVMAESLEGYMDIVKERVNTIRKTIEGLQKRNRYLEAVESFETPIYEDVPEDVKENWIDQLTIRQFNEELKDVFPYIYRLIGEATRVRELGPEDILGEHTLEDEKIDEDRYRSNKKYQLVDQDYNNFKIYVSVDKIVQNQFMATAVSNASEREPEGVKTLADNAKKAVELVKQKLDDRIQKAKKLIGDATLDFNVAFSRDFFDNDADDLGIEDFKMMYVKILPGPKLVIANTGEYGDMPDLLTSDGFSRAGIRNNVSTPMASVKLSAKRVQNAELIANGRYILGTPTQDKDGHYVYPMKFESVVMDKGEKVSFKYPAVTVGSSRFQETQMSEKWKKTANAPADPGELASAGEPQVDADTRVNKKAYVLDKASKSNKKVSVKKAPWEENIEEHFESLMGQFSENDKTRGGALYVKFAAKNSSERDGRGKTKQYLIGYAGFGHDPKEVQFKTSNRQLMNIENFKDIETFVKDLKNEEVFLKAKKIIIYRTSKGLEKKFPALKKFYDVIENYTGKDISVEMSPNYGVIPGSDDPNKDIAFLKVRIPGHSKDIKLGIGAFKSFNDEEILPKTQGEVIEGPYKGQPAIVTGVTYKEKKEREYHYTAQKFKDIKAPEKKMTRAFTISNQKLFSYLRKTKPDFMRDNFKPNIGNRGGFMMNDKTFKEFEKYIKSPEVVDRFGETIIFIDHEKSFAEDQNTQTPKTPLSEFVLSYFDRTTGQFPKGETAILTMVEKDYGEEFIEPAKAFIEQINNRVSEVMGYRDTEINRITDLAGL